MQLPYGTQLAEWLADADRKTFFASRDDEHHVAQVSNLVTNDAASGMPFQSKGSDQANDKPNGRRASPKEVSGRHVRRLGTLTDSESPRQPPGGRELSRSGQVPPPSPSKPASSPRTRRAKPLIPGWTLRSALESN